MAKSRQTTRATSYDVAVAAGVSQSTVSRCFQEDSAISPDTRAHVIAVAEGLGYRPNAVARSLIMGRSNVIGVVVARYTLHNNPDLLYAVSEVLAAHDLTLLLITVADDHEGEATLHNASEFPLDGVISCATLSREDIERFQRFGIPVVFLNRHIAASGVDCVTTDNAAAARQMADALFRAGHRRFLCIAGPEGAPVSDIRIDGFVTRVKELGARQVEIACSDFSYEAGSAAMLRHASAKPIAFDAVFCANDQLALGAIDACRYELRLRVPDDISVVGFDDIAEAARPTYRLTTVRQQVATLAGKAVDLLASRRLKPGMRARLVTLPGELIKRDSARMDLPDPDLPAVTKSTP
ncbi:MULTISPECIES: LacI family DNA-binding transcriptional regulator [unclassified Caballeronia]|uniref:LacI family DNA-binding transcriptional regulator n=1 Tax=unclassified Caballeronia TaxID=2646786 RepID=UPI002028DB0A|nr:MULTISPECIES: LacI family DNA-binding transcriptional regulator [unclassified Caballeronia]